MIGPKRTRSERGTARAYYGAARQPYDGVPPTYSALEAAWRSLEGRAELRLDPVRCEVAGRTLLAATIERGTGRRVALAAGVHGDEPAAPSALLAAVRDGLLDQGFDYRLWPCTNPTGYVAGTRRNAEDADVNRSFTDGGATPEARAIIAASRQGPVALSIDLHEDLDADGCYCYVAGPHAEPLGAAVVGALDAAGLCVQSFEGFDFDEPAAVNPNRRLDHGIVVMNPEEEAAYYAGGLSYNLFMAQHAARHVVTFETPSRRAWDERIAMHRVAIVAAIAFVARLAGSERA